MTDGSLIADILDVKDSSSVKESGRDVKDNGVNSDGADVVGTSGNCVFGSLLPSRDAESEAANDADAEAANDVKRRDVEVVNE